MEVHGIPWSEPLFKGMCYMVGMCFVMLTPMLYISVCRKICGVIRGKVFAHVPMVSSIALDYVYCNGVAPDTSIVVPCSTLTKNQK